MMESHFAGLTDPEYSSSADLATADGQPGYSKESSDPAGGGRDPNDKQNTPPIKEVIEDN